MLKIKEKNLIKTLVRDFFCGIYSSQSGELNITWDAQKLLIDSTILSPLVRKYPMNKDYCRAFLKKVIHDLEKCCEYIHDDLYSCYCTMMESSTESENFYKHYMAEGQENFFVTIKESSILIGHGTTGLRTWEAAAVLADWALCNKQEFKNNNILELGSGLGMTGIFISKLCAPASYCFSDYHPRVLKALEENILVNYPEAIKSNESENSVDFTCNNKEYHLNVLNLDWNAVHEGIFPRVPDVVIGADIVYDASTFTALCGVLKTVTDMRKNVNILLVSTIRNEETIQEFIKHLHQNEFKISFIQHKISKYIYWSDKQEYCILKIYS